MPCRAALARPWHTRTQGSVRATREGMALVSESTFRKGRTWMAVGDEDTLNLLLLVGGEELQKTVETVSLAHGQVGLSF